MVRFLSIFILTIAAHSVLAAQRDWRGTTSANWNIASNWVQGIVPAAGDDVFIGINSAITTQPAVPVGVTATCSTITFGISGITLTVNGTLNVSGNILQRHNTGSGNVNTLVTGAGTINCGGSFTVGHNVGNLNLFATNTTTVKCNVALLRITGDLIANSSSYTFVGLANFINNALFDLANDNGTTNSIIEVTGQVRTTNQTPITNTTAIVRISEPGNNLAILRMFNTTPVNVQNSTYGAVDFYSNTGGTGATAEYAATSGTQTVYTSATSGVGQYPSVYQNIRFSGAGAKVASSTNSITIAGDWISAGGNIAVTGAPVIFQGVTQTLTDAGSNGGAGVLFGNVTFQGGGTKTIDGTASQASAFSVWPTGTLTMAASSTLAVGTYGTLTLQSTIAGDARVAVIPTGCSITGNVSVQRFFKAGTIAANTRNYRLLSSPVNANGTVVNSTTGTAYYSLSYLSGNPGVYTGGPGGSASGFTVANAAPTVYLYKENLAASNATFNSGNFKGLTNITGNTVTPYNDAGTAPDAAVNLYSGNGYMLYYVGNNVNNLSSTTALNKQFRVGGAYIDPDAATATAVGTLNQGAVPVKIYWSGSNTLSNVRTGFNLVGNPYASSIDWETFSTSSPSAGIYGPGVGNSVYVFNYTNKNYGIYQQGVGGTGNASRYIVSGQGFFVKASSTTARLTFNEAAKSTQPPAVVLMGMPAETAQRPQLLRIRLAKDSVDTDESLIVFEAGAANTDDGNDVIRLNGIGNVATLASYSKQGTQMLAINHQNLIDSTTRIRLHVAMTGTASRDTLSITGFDSLDPRYNCFLVDNYKKDSLQISTYGKYLFNIRPDSAQSFGANRFELVFHKKADFNYRLLSFTGVKTNDGIKLTWKTEREQNATGFVLQKADGTQTYIPLYKLQSNGAGTYSYTDASPVKGANTYRLQQNDPFGQTRLSAPVSINYEIGNVNALLVAYPNPVVNDVSVQINGTDVPNKVQLRVIDFSGRALIDRAVPGNNIQENLSRLTSGTYIIEVADAATKKVIGRTKISKP